MFINYVDCLYNFKIVIHKLIKHISTETPFYSLQHVYISKMYVSPR